MITFDVAIMIVCLRKTESFEMKDANNRSELNCVTIGILTALEVEYAACREVFDPGRCGAERQCRATSGTFTCWLCRVADRRGGGIHVVAITLLPDMGNNAAAIAANILLQHCPKTQYLIMCGIAGDFRIQTSAKITCV